MTSKKSRLDNKTLLILAGVLGVESLICLGVGTSIYNRKGALEKTLSGKEAALANVRTVSASLPALQTEYLRMQVQVQYLERALPPAEYIPTLLGQVEQTARTSGVQIQEFRPKQEPAQNAANATEGDKAGNDGGITKMQFDVIVRGEYGQIQAFLQSLTRFRKILALDSVRLTPATTSANNTSPTLSGALSFTAYALPPSTESAAPSAPAASEAPVRAATNDTAEAPGTAPRG